MPWAPRRPCPTPGCPRLLAPGQQCPRHSRQAPFSTSTYRTRRAIPEPLRQQILHRDNHQCVICGQPGNIVDHIVARAFGGIDEPANLQTLCSKHSASKAGAEGQAARQARAPSAQRTSHIAITGQAAAGKTELAKRLSARTGIPTLMIDDVHGNWPLFRHEAHRHQGPLILESIALPRWPLALHIYCHCDETARQKRLKRRPAGHSGPPNPRYNHTKTADLTIDTTGRADLTLILDHIHHALGGVRA